MENTALSAQSQSPHPPSPEHLFLTINSYQRSAAIQAAIDLDLFTAIAAGANEPASLARQVGAAERGVRILSDALTMLGFLTKQDGRYALTEESSLFLDRRSPAYLGSIADFLLNDHLLHAFRHLADAVRKGGTVHTEGDNEKPNDGMWVTFAKSMAPMTRPLAQAIARLTGMGEGKPCRVLDIAAGHGTYGITMAIANPHAQVVAVDWPNVLAVAQQNARAVGVGDRYEIRPGSAFEADFGEGYDYVLLTNILHHFDPDAIERLMRRVHAALKPGGKAVVLEFVPNEDRISPFTSAMFSLTMLAVTDSGDAYPFSEFKKLFEHAGFRDTSLHPVPGMPQQVVFAEK